MLFGMTIFAGLLEAAIAPLLNRMRAIFPPEISGLVILMIGMSAGTSNRGPEPAASSLDISRHPPSAPEFRRAPAR